MEDVVGEPGRVVAGYSGKMATPGISVSIVCTFQRLREEGISKPEEFGVGTSYKVSRRFILLFAEAHHKFEHAILQGIELFGLGRGEVPGGTAPEQGG